MKSEIIFELKSDNGQLLVNRAESSVWADIVKNLEEEEILEALEAMKTIVKYNFIIKDDIQDESEPVFPGDNQDFPLPEMRNILETEAPK